MANALHSVEDQAAFVYGDISTRLLIVEYDTRGAPTGPYVVMQARMTDLFERAGFRSSRSRPSVYRRASLYAAVIAPLRRLHDFRRILSGES
jgi:hypothetical protein